MAAAVWVGIDVSKARLDVALGAEGELFEVANDQRGIAALLARPSQPALARVVVEATGGLETALLAELGVAGLPVVVVNPRQVRDFARATGQLGKTDALDARLLARFAERVQPPRRALANAAVREERHARHEVRGATAGASTAIEVPLDRAEYRSRRGRRRLTREQLGRTGAWRGSYGDSSAPTRSTFRVFVSSQSRIAKMEAADPSVSIDLMLRALLRMGASRKEVASYISAPRRKHAAVFTA